MKKIYAGIGSRETPKEVLAHMSRLASLLGRAGWTLRSGRAIGADTAFENGARSVGGKCEIFLPDESSYMPMSQMSYDPLKPSYMDEHTGSVLACKLIARLIHPNGKKLTPNALELHARNTYQIMGRDLNTPCDVVICWTEGGLGGGGTGQAIRLAKLLGIQIIDFGMYDNGAKWYELINYICSVYGVNQYGT